MRPFMLTALLVASTMLFGGSMKTLSFYVASYVEKGPVLDGTLGDAAWEKATPAMTFYEYWKPNPGPAKNSTEYRMLYDDRGLYLGIINYDANVAGIRSVYTTRDAEQLWQDDCNEIYFDAFGEGIGYTKFVVNAIGTMGDSRRIDAAVSLPEWNGSGWQVRTAKRADGWSLTAFIPWSDVERPAAEGSIWRFCLVRYAYSSGAFVGATSSPGGNYQSPGNFGFLYFTKSPVPADVVGRVLAKKATPPWALPYDDGLIEHRGTAPAYKRMDDHIRDAQASFDAGRKETLSLLERNASVKGVDAWKKKYDAVISGAALQFDGLSIDERFRVAAQLSGLASQLKDIYWEMSIIELVETP